MFLVEGTREDLQSLPKIGTKYDCQTLQEMFTLLEEINPWKQTVWIVFQNKNDIVPIWVGRYFPSQVENWCKALGSLYVELSSKRYSILGFYIVKDPEKKSPYIPKGCIKVSRTWLIGKVLNEADALEKLDGVARVKVIFRKNDTTYVTHPLRVFTQAELSDLLWSIKNTHGLSDIFSEWIIGYILLK